MLHVFLFKHVKFRNQAWLCLAILDYEAHIMLNFLKFRATGMGKM